MVVADDGDIPLFEAAYRSGLIDDEALLHAKASVGTNIAISKILGVQKVSEGFSKKFAKSLANFDNHLLNKDRYKENPNILFCRPNKRHYAIDFGQALLEHRAYEAMIDGYFDRYMMQLRTCDIFKERRYLLRESEHMRPKVSLTRCAI